MCGSITPSLHIQAQGLCMIALSSIAKADSLLLLLCISTSSPSLASQTYFSPCAHARIIKEAGACAHGEKYGWLARLIITNGLTTVTTYLPPL